MSKRKNHKKDALRICLGCGLEHPKKEMMRILLTHGEETLDPTGRMNGRGAYLCRNSSCIEKAFAEGKISEAVRDKSLDDLEQYKWSFLSLAAKAGAVASGEFQVEEAIQKGSAWLVIVAEDASDNTAHKFESKCSFYQVPFTKCGSKELLGARIGKEMRSMVAICDESFATKAYGLFGIETE